MHKTSVSHIKIRPYEQCAIELIWPQEISDLQLNEINCIKAELQRHYQNLLQDVVSTYANLLLVYKNPIEVNSEINVIKYLLERATVKFNGSCNRWIIPVCYDYTLAQDLEWFCKSKGLTLNSFINLHSGRDYRLHFYGFLPGFFYLGGLDSKLHMPRRAQPRSKVAQGTVAIGGEQTGIYPQESPGGCH